MLSIQQTIEKYYKIRTKNGELKPLVMNQAQQKVYNIFKEQYNSGKPIRLIILKARQLGISTLTEAIITEQCTTRANTNALIVAHDSDSTNNIYNMTKLYYECLPNAIKPMIKYSNAKELRFENPTQDAQEKETKPGLRSGVRVSTSGSSGIARGSTFQLVHISELAFWGDNAKEELNGIFQAVPSVPKSMIVIESTANGYNQFKELWDRAISGESDYTPIFIPWYTLDEYQATYSGFELTDDEQQIKRLYNLTNEQLQWRRNVINNQCQGDIELFKQEYPISPEEAFITSGNSVFDSSIVQSKIKELQANSPITKTGIFEGNEFVEDTKGIIDIYETPKPNTPYVIGADTSGEGSDYFVAYVIDNTNGRQVARYRCQVDEDQFTEQIFHLGMYYNTALIGIESNFSSYPIKQLTNMGYTRQYVRETEDTYKAKYSDKFGFRTTSITRPIIIANLVKIVREDIDLIKDIDLLRECLTFIRTDTGRAEADVGQHDDCVMAAAITYYIRTQQDMGSIMYDDIEDKEDNSYNGFLNYGG